MTRSRASRRLVGWHPTWRPSRASMPARGRDYEYQRHGTLTLMAGLDLISGHLHRAVVERHRSREFVAFLRQLDRAYPAGARIRLVLDNHSAHVSKETRAYLTTMANRFEFVFTPKHGSWLNVVESFFAKLTNTPVARDAGGVQGGTAATHRTLHRPAERRSGGVQVDLQDGRDFGRLNTDMLFWNRPTSQVQIPFEGVILQEHSAPISCPTPNFAKGSSEYVDPVGGHN